MFVLSLSHISFTFLNLVILSGIFENSAFSFKCNFYLGYVQHIRTIRDPCLKLYYARPVCISTFNLFSLTYLLVCVNVCSHACVVVIDTHICCVSFCMYASANVFVYSCDMLQIFRNISRGTPRAILVIRLQQNYTKTMQSSAASFSINILIRQLSKNDTNIDDCWLDRSKYHHWKTPGRITTIR